MFLKNSWTGTCIQVHIGWIWDCTKSVLHPNDFGHFSIEKDYILIIMHVGTILLLIPVIIKQVKFFFYALIAYKLSSLYTGYITVRVFSCLAIHDNHLLPAAILTYSPTHSMVLVYCVQIMSSEHGLSLVSHLWGLDQRAE